MRRSTAEHAEIAGKSQEFFSAGSPAPAFNVILFTRSEAFALR
jgi:hypothetical protein